MTSMPFRQQLGRNYAFPEYKPRYAPDPGFSLKHVKAELQVDFAERSVTGVVTLFVAGNRLSAAHLKLDACDMSILGVTGGRGEQLKYDYDGRALDIYLGQGLGEGEEYRFTVSYNTRPKKGIYFIPADEHYQDISPQLWSHGEAEDTRYWIPLYDYPNNKATSELIVTAPSGLIVVSNGDLVSVVDKGELRTWHWKMNKPHSTYLISLVIGEFHETVEEVDGVKLHYYVPKGRDMDAARTFSKTPDMMRFFNHYTGFAYPYSRYSQTCVSEFIYGGMENISATTLTDLTLHDEKAHADFSSDPLVAHELAHQWFGDLVTAKDWAHVWLHESFATYFEHLYTLKDLGQEEFAYELFQDLNSYLDEYRRRYSRPIVTRLYSIPDEVFDAHTYPKGALVLHTLRSLLEEDVFRRSIGLFLTNHAYGNADTEDLRKAAESASGRNLELFFDQFVHSAGHPVLKVSYSWDAGDKTLKLTLQQANGDDAPPTYRLPLEIEFRSANLKERRVIWLEEKEQVFSYTLSEKPDFICIDPDFKIIRVLEVDAGMEDWIRQLSCEHVACRILAATSLVKFKSSRVVEALKKSVMEDGFWGVSAEAARSMGKIGLQEALDALHTCAAGVRHPKVRRAVAEALGSFKGETAGRLLQEILRNPDESYYVRHQAASSLGKTGWKNAFELLVEALRVPAHNHVVTVGALQGLAEIGGEESLRTILQHTELGRPTVVRGWATQVLGKFPGRKEVMDRLLDLSKDQFYRVRIATVLAAEELLDEKMLPMLDSLVGVDLDGRVRRRAREVAKKIRDHAEKGSEYKQLRSEIEDVREENRRLLDRLARLETKGL